MRRFSTYRAIYGAAGLVALGLLSHANAANLLTNPGFEAPPSGDTVDSQASGWTFVVDCQRAGFHDHTTGSGKSIWMKTFENTPLGSDGIFQTVSNVQAGTPYSLSGFTWFETGYNQSTSFIQMGMIWLDNSNNPVGTPTALNIDPTSNPLTNQWVSLSVSGNAPVNATKVMVSMGWSGGAVVSGQSQSVFFDDMDLEGAGIAPTGSTWIVNGSGDWNVLGNWASGVVPNGVGAQADFLGAITASHTVYSDVAITAGIINFNNANSYVITGAGSLTLQASAGNAQINVQAGTQKLNLPTTIASNAVFNVSPGATLIVADPLTINSGKTVTQTGSGTVTYQSTVNVLGGAGIVFGNSSHAHELDVASTGTAQIGGTSSTLTVDVLANAGKLDVKTNKLVVAYGNGANPSTTIASQLTTGYAGGAWNGNGINTSSSTAKIGVGWKDDTTAKAVTVRYAYYGDANVDGTVNSADFSNLAAHFNQSGGNGIWVNGDFNYDGKVNALDFNALATNYGSAPLPGDALGSLVPEPASMLVIAPIATVVASRRRRQIIT
jgi:hypothetical protein